MKLTDSIKLTGLVKLTGLEMKMVETSQNTNMGDIETGVFTFDLIEASGMDEQVAGGVIASLIKKGVFESFMDGSLQVVALITDEWLDGPGLLDEWVEEASCFAETSQNTNMGDIETGVSASQKSPLIEAKLEEAIEDIYTKYFGDIEENKIITNKSAGISGDKREGCPVGTFPGGGYKEHGGNTKVWKQGV